MPKIPKYESRVGISDPTFVPKNLSAYTPQALGAGAGQALSQMGKIISAKAEEMQDQEDAARALEAVNALSAWEREFFNDPEKGLFSKKNGDAVGIYDMATEAYQKKRDELMSKLGNDRQRMAFDRTSSSSMNARLQAVASHEQAERKNWMVATAKQTVESKLADIQANWSDPNAVAVAVDDARKAIMAMSPGMGQDYVDTVMKEFISQAHTSRIDSALKADQPDRAREIFRNHEKELSGTVREKVRKAISDAEMSRFVQEESDNLFSKFGLDGESKAAKWVRDHYEGDKETRLMAQIQARYADERRFEAQREQQVFDSIYAGIEQAGSLAGALSLIDGADIKAKHRASLKAFATSLYDVKNEASLPKTDVKTATSIQDLLDKEKLFSEYPTWNEFFAEFGGGLSFSDRNRYHKMYSSLDTEEDPAVQYSLQKAINAQIKEIELDDPVEQSKYHDSVLAHIAYEEKRLGRKLSTTEKAEIIKDLAEEKVLKRVKFWKDPKAMGYDIPPGYEFNEEYNGYLRIDPVTGIAYNLDMVAVGKMMPEEED
jgi:hypothetical protein